MLTRIWGPFSVHLFSFLPWNKKSANINFHIVSLELDRPAVIVIIMVTLKTELDCLPLWAMWAVKDINGPCKLEGWGDCGSEPNIHKRVSYRRPFQHLHYTEPFLLTEQALNFPRLLIWHLSRTSLLTLENKKTNS